MLAPTLRARFGVSVDDIGDRVSWGEARDLILSCSADTSTEFGAHLAGWGYPSSLVELLQLAATIGNKKAFEAAAPWTMGERQRQREAATVTPGELAELEAQLDADFVFS